MTAGPEADRRILSLSGPQTIREAVQTHALLLDALHGEQSQAVALDCADVTQADLTFVQLVLAARRSADAAGRSLTLLHPPAGALAEALLRGGLRPVADPAQWASAGGDA